MTGELAATLSAREAAERRAALRLLLRRPLLLEAEEPEAFVAVVRHRSWLAAWLSDQPGWKLAVDPAAGVARLLKVPLRAEAIRPCGARGRPLDRRRATLACLALAALEDSPVQTTLARLAELVEGLSRDDPEVPPFEPDRYAERRAFVDALRWLLELGVLAARDGETEGYARSRDADVLYDVRDRVLRLLLACPVPPSLAGWADRLLEEVYPETAEGARLRARHRVFRALLDEPAVYLDDLEAREREWLDHSRGFVYSRLEEDLGFLVERRREGLAAVDPEGTSSVELFPDGGSTARHAALLLAELLAERGRAEPGRVVADREVEALVAGLARDHAERCGWSKEYDLGSGGASRLARDATGVLERFRLLARAEGGWVPRPAVARFAPEVRAKRPRRTRG